ncbi:MAG: dTDP-4-dehydrorhamnose 3,5-epimerase [Actinophytocola sp.]|nr:dTDP-4-dehydrorhamnose 3,5-epimerase [Actinophytocola sp.]
MQVTELAVPDAYVFTPTTFPDDRGLFCTPFQAAALREATGHGLRVEQTNHSVSRRGVIRGIHFADTPPGQAKYVYCPRGALLDVVVDVRVGSPTFGQWDAVRLDAESYRAVYISEGIGHGFVALTDDTAMNYLCSTGYNPSAERGINPQDEALGLPWPAERDPVLSEKDTAAPTLAEAAEAGILPDYKDCVARYEELRAEADVTSWA